MLHSRGHIKHINKINCQNYVLCYHFLKANLQQQNTTVVKIFKWTQRDILECLNGKFLCETFYTKLEAVFDRSVIGGVVCSTCLPDKLNLLLDVCKQMHELDQEGM